MDYVIQDCWTMISQDLVDTAINQFSKRLTLTIRAQGGHIEHRLKAELGLTRWAGQSPT